MKSISERMINSDYSGGVLAAMVFCTFLTAAALEIPSRILAVNYENDNFWISQLNFELQSSIIVTVAVFIVTFTYLELNEWRMVILTCNLVGIVILAFVLITVQWTTAVKYAPFDSWLSSTECWQVSFCIALVALTNRHYIHYLSQQVFVIMAAATASWTYCAIFMLIRIVRHRRRLSAAMRRQATSTGSSATVSSPSYNCSQVTTDNDCETSSESATNSMLDSYFTTDSGDQSGVADSL